jgi:hypothetical protein
MCHTPVLLAVASASLPPRLDQIVLRNWVDPDRAAGGHCQNKVQILEHLFEGLGLRV